MFTPDSTYISDGNVNTIFGADPSISVDPGGTETRALLQVPIFVSEGGSIPDGSTIDSATLELKVTNSSVNAVNVHEVITAWSEDTVTWANFNSGGVAGTDYVATVADSVTPGLPTDPPTSFDIQSIVQRWSNGESVNNGVFLISAADVDNTDGVLWDSDDSSGTLPKLTVEFTAIPEPSQFLLMGLVMGAIVALKKWKKKTSD